MGERYDFTDVWTVAVDIEIAWRMVDDVASWPKWWPNYRLTELVSTVPNGLGDRWHARVKADLPYTLDFHFTVIVHEPPTYFRVRVEGFFEGEVGWRLEQVSKGSTRLTLHEQTETKWPLINLTARLGGRRLLEANHRSAMRDGEKGMKAALAAGYLPPDLVGRRLGPG
jgi:hypothetical protein